MTIKLAQYDVALN